MVQQVFSIFLGLVQVQDGCPSLIISASTSTNPQEHQNLAVPHGPGEQLEGVEQGNRAVSPVQG